VPGPRASRPAPPPLPFPRGAGTIFTIGRDRECDLAIDDMTVSRLHARLERTSGGWRLTDLGSTNGTRVNGWRLRDAVLVRAGDLVRFGETEYTLAGPEDQQRQPRNQQRQP
jgi:pSer/pThr/pTyr-binding forkhead associated (FHA) protein